MQTSSEIQKSSTTIKIKSLSKTVTDHVRNEIIKGELKPGSRINESELSSRLGIGRATLREGLRTLEKEHLLYTIDRKGTFICDLSIDDLYQLYKARLMIELFSIDLLEESKDLRLIKQTEDIFKGDSVLKSVALCSGFHRDLVASTKNDFLISFYSSLAPSLARFQFIYLYVPTPLRKVSGEHAVIVRYIETAKFKEAKKLLRKHIWNSFEVLKEKIMTS